MILDFSELNPQQRYLTMVQTIIPRPIAWVLSDSGNGCLNLAPYSFFTAICSDPPLILFSGGKKPAGEEAGRMKDTCLNIRERKDFVVHIASTDMVEAVNQSAATLNHNVSELETLGLGTSNFPGFSLPRLSDCSVAFGCTLYRVDDIGNAPQSVIYGEIKQAYIAPSIMSDSSSIPPRIAAKELNPVAKLGGTYYSGLGELLSLARPE